MTKKLTLKVNDRLIETAKRYAGNHQRSLSQLVEDYFRFLSEQEPAERIPISPTVEELSGTIRLPQEYNRKADYARHLSEKYS